MAQLTSLKKHTHIVDEIADAATSCCKASHSVVFEIKDGRITETRNPESFQLQSLISRLIEENRDTLIFDPEELGFDKNPDWKQAGVILFQGPHGIPELGLGILGNELAEINAASLNIAHQLGSRLLKINGQLKDKEESLVDCKNLIEHNSDAVYVFGLDGKIINSSGAATSMLGWSPEELADLTLEDLDINVTNQLFGSYWQDYPLAKPRIFETIHRTKTGKKVPVEISGVKGEYDGEARIYCTCRSLMDREQTRSRLKESEERFKSLFEQDKVIKLIIDPDTGNILDGNKAALQFYGYTAEDFKKRNIRDLNIHDWSEIESRMNEVKTGKNGHFQFVHQLANGERRDVDVYSTVITYNDKKRLFSIIHDITDQVKAERAQRENEALYHSLFDNSEVGIAFVGASGFITQANDSLIKLLGYTDQEIINLSFPEITNPEDLIKVAGLLLEITEGRRDSYSLEKRLRRKDGKYIWVKVSYTVIRNDQGQVYYGICIILDISTIKLYQKRLEERNQQFKIANQELEANNELIQSINFDLQKANSELDNFVYRVSHDLRAPIASSMGLANLQMATENVEELQQYASLQLKSMQKLDDFISDILHYSRNSRVDVTAEEVNFRELIDEVLQENWAKIKPTTKVEVKVADFPCRGDILRIRIILKNLITNAIQYQDPFKEQGQITVQVVNEGEGWTLSVIDNGIGIKEEYQSRIFDMFYRGTEFSIGSGIGLYITRECVEKIGGQIELETEYRKGTTFRVKAPML